MGYIFESEIVTIMNTVRVRTIGESDAIKLKEILAADIHSAIKAYFKAEVERMLLQERAKEVRSGRFTYGLPEVVGLQRQIDLLLINHYEFNQQEFESLLDEAVHFQFNFLCRPRWTLQEFLFENRRAVPTSEILRKLRYCVEYRYFAEIFRRYVIDRGLAEIGYEEFRRLMEKIDMEVVSRHSSTELARLLKPMVEFVEVGIPDTRMSEAGPLLPMNAAIVFFEDKGMHDIQSKLEFERDSNGIKGVSIPDLIRIIGEVRGEETERGGAGAREKGEVEHQETVQKSVTKAKTMTVTPVHEKERHIQGKDQRSEASDHARVSETRPAGKTFPHRLVEDVYSLFTLKEQRLFVRKLFRKDEVEFRNALDRLNPISTWKEASLVLDEIFNANNVDPFSKEAIRLTDKLSSRYGGTGREKV
ncbi:MAG: hypothetical protein HYW57_03815 [Ignavibacteriales bacterium]|nr:hypothetical protein [Ignavibacteriales bacterium]